jgi:hypothetical protein
MVVPRAPFAAKSDVAAGFCFELPTDSFLAQTGDSGLVQAIGSSATRQHNGGPKGRAKIQDLEHRAQTMPAFKLIEHAR